MDFSKTMPWVLGHIMLNEPHKKFGNDITENHTQTHNIMILKKFKKIFFFFLSFSISRPFPCGKNSYFKYLRGYEFSLGNILENV